VCYRGRRGVEGREGRKMVKEGRGRGVYI